jgi:hypothetical protein
MFQRGDGARFAPEPRGEFFVAGQVGMQNFDRDVPVKVGLVRFVHLRHPALSEFFGEAIFAECGTGEISWTAAWLLRAVWVLSHRLSPTWGW